MKNKEILASAARLAGKEDVAAYFSDGSPENTEAAKREGEFFTVALSLALTDIAHKKAAPVAEEEITSDGFVYYDSLSYRPMKILSVIEGGREKAFTAHAEGVITPVGKITVRYARFPEPGGAEDEVDLAATVPPAAAVYFVAAECLAKEGATLRAEEFAEKYEKLLFCGVKNQAGVLPARRWNG